MSKPSRHDRGGVRRRRVRANVPPADTGKLVKKASEIYICGYCGATVIERNGVWLDPMFLGDEDPAVCASQSGQGGPHKPLEVQRKPRRQLGTLTREEYDTRHSTEGEVMPPPEDTRDEVPYPEWTERDHYSDKAERDDDAQQ